MKKLVLVMLCLCLQGCSWCGYYDVRDWFLYGISPVQPKTDDRAADDHAKADKIEAKSTHFNP